MVECTVSLCAAGHKYHRDSGQRLQQEPQKESGDLLRCTLDTSGDANSGANIGEMSCIVGYLRCIVVHLILFPKSCRQQTGNWAGVQGQHGRQVK